MLPLIQAEVEAHGWMAQEEIVNFIAVGATVFFPAGFALQAVSPVAFLLSLAVFVLMLVLALKKVHPIVLICLSAVIGIAAGYIFNIEV